MSSQCEAAGRSVAGAPIGFFERYLTLWVSLCIVAGTLLGLYAPATAQAVGALELAHVNIPVGLLIWVMIVPMLMKIDFSSLREVYAHRASMGITLFVNWAVKPFTMALLGWVFIKHLFAAWLPAAELDSYMAGLILLGAAPCTAMVFVWSNLCNGNANFTLTQVALNDAVMVFAFAPIVALLLGVSSIPVPWDTLLLSVLTYIVIPLTIAQVIRTLLQLPGAADGVGLGLVIAMLAVPIFLQTLLIAGLGYWLNRKWRVRHDVAGPSAMIGASNFFELAVAVAIVLYGFNSGAALATVVGVLIEVPVLLWLVRIVNRSRQWYDRGLDRT